MPAATEQTCLKYNTYLRSNWVKMLFDLSPLSQLHLGKCLDPRSPSFSLQLGKIGMPGLTYCTACPAVGTVTTKKTKAMTQITLFVRLQFSVENLLKNYKLVNSYRSRIIIIKKGKDSSAL